VVTMSTEGLLNDDVVAKRLPRLGILLYQQFEVS